MPTSRGPRSATPGICSSRRSTKEASSRPINFVYSYLIPEFKSLFKNHENELPAGFRGATEREGTVGQATCYLDNLNADHRRSGRLCLFRGEVAVGADRMRQHRLRKLRHKSPATRGLNRNCDCQNRPRPRRLGRRSTSTEVKSLPCSRCHADNGTASACPSAAARHFPGKHGSVEIWPRLSFPPKAPFTVHHAASLIPSSANLRYSVDRPIPRRRATSVIRPR